MKKFLKKVIRHPLFSGSATMIVGLNTANGLNYLYHLIIGRLLGPSLYGELASLISVIGLLGIIPGAVSLVIVKQISSTKSEQEVNNLTKWFTKKIFTIALIFSALILISSPLISSFLNIHSISYFILISLSSFFSLQSGFNRSILQGLLKFKEFVISVLAENGIKLIFSAVLIYIGFQVQGAMVAFLISGFLGFYITIFYLGYNKPTTSNFSPDVRSMLIFTIPVLIQTISVTSLYTTDVILVKHFFSSYDAGIYASLSTLGKIIFFGAGPISSVMFPLVSNRNSKGEKYHKVFIYSFIATMIFSLGVCFFYWLVPKIAIDLLFGSAYLQSSKLLIWFGIFMSLFTLSSLIINFGISLGRNKITIFPFIYAILQIILITLFHKSLFMVILISNGVTALLLITLLIYLVFKQRVFYEDKINFFNSSSL